MKAVIMAGGEGTRLRPLTCNIPKPMVPVANKPVMEHIINLLKKNSLTDIAVTLQYLPERIKEYFHDGSEFGVNLRYYVENTPLGTAGSVKNAEDMLNDTFIVISGDALTDIDLSRAVDFHFQKNSIATLVLKRVDVPLEYGVVVVNEEGRIARFLEKPSWGEVFSDTVNTGIYILSPEVLKFFNKNEMFDFSKDLFPIILKNNLPMYGYITEDYWCDIGDLKAYSQAHIDMLDGKVKVDIPGKQVRDKVWIDEGCTIDEAASINAPCIIGANTRIKSDAFIGSYSVIGEWNSIDSRASVKRSITWKNCILDNQVEIRGVILCNKVQMKEKSSAFEQSVTGDESVVKEQAVIKPGIKIWPHKVIDTGTEVNSNLVWGAKFTKSIFGHRGIAGEINVDITPEFASKLGAAYGATLKGKGRIGISSDESNSSYMLKISFISGMMSSGIEVYDLGKLLLPMVRSAIRFYRFDGGIHISTSADNEEQLFIDFLDKNGASINRGMERKIENVFTREDFSRCEGDCVKKVKYVGGFAGYYSRSILNSLKINKLNYKVLINCRSPYVLSNVRDLLEELGCEVDSTRLNIMDTRTKREILSANELNYFTGYVRMMGADIGASIEPTGEKMILVDEKGRVVNEDTFIALICLILFKSARGNTVVVPISSSHVVEKMAEAYNGKVIRTKTSEQDMMHMILGSEISQQAPDQFTMHFDAIAGLMKILDFMYTNKLKLSQLVEMIPDIHMDKKMVECPWDAKGKVIRELVQDKTNGNIETLEGVKVYHEGGWVLVIPDAEQPVCRVIGEGFTSEFAEELTGMYADKIRKISRQES